MKSIWYGYTNAVYHTHKYRSSLPCNMNQTLGTCLYPLMEVKVLTTYIVLQEGIVTGLDRLPDWTTGLTQTTIKDLAQCRTEAKHRFTQLLH